MTLIIHYLIILMVLIILFFFIVPAIIKDLYIAFIKLINFALFTEMFTVCWAVIIY